jgi:hypothetical protein
MHCTSRWDAGWLLQSSKEHMQGRGLAITKHYICHIVFSGFGTCSG